MFLISCKEKLLCCSRQDACAWVSVGGCSVRPRGSRGKLALTIPFSWVGEVWGWELKVLLSHIPLSELLACSVRHRWNFFCPPLVLHLGQTGSNSTSLSCSINTWRQGLLGLLIPEDSAITFCNSYPQKPALGNYWPLESAGRVLHSKELTLLWLLLPAAVSRSVVPLQGLLRGAGVCG